MVQRSLDNKYVRVETVSENIKGAVRLISAEENKIFIDSTEYALDAEFINNTGFTLEISKNYTFWKGANGKLVYAENGISSMDYGYVVKCYKEAGGERAIIRLLGESGSMLELYADDKVLVDGTSVNGINIDRSIENSLIRYSQNKDGEINKIDTPAAPSDSYVDMNTAKENDCLTKYNITKNLIYKSNTSMFGDGFGASEAIIFMVPSDTSITDKSYYNIATTAIFNNDTSYSPEQIEAYNINKYRNAEVIVYKNTSNVIQLYGSETKSAVVDKINVAVNDSDEVVYQITYFMDNKFVTAELSNDISPVKKSGEMICAGDIIRFSMQDGVIKSLIVDFDSDANILEGNADSDALFNVEESRIIQYQSGMIGDFKGRNMLLTSPDVRDASNPEDFNWGSLRLIAAPTSNIVLVNRICTQNANGTITVKNSEVRRIEPYEILTYENSNSKADFAVIRQRYLEPLQMIIYRNNIE